jgi:isopentenyldiphosphate isomerase
MDEENEILDLVNDNDEVIGTITRGEMVRANYISPKGRIRFVNAFIVNKEGKVWVPKRGMHKKTSPGGLDFSVGEHMQSGETYEQGIARAFKEEANLDISKIKLVLIERQLPGEVNYGFVKIYATFDYDGPDPEYSKEEFVSASWMDPREFLEVLKTKPSKKSLPLSLQTLLDYIGKSKHNTT